MNKLNTGPSLAFVVMPLVRVMAEADLSWAARMKVADAILVSIGAWRSMEEERLFSQQSAGSTGPRQGTTHTGDAK